MIHVFLKPDSAAEIKMWTEHLDLEALKSQPVIYQDEDAKLAKAYEIPGGYQFHGESVHYPALVVLDGKGAELFRYIGKNNGDRMSPVEFSAKLASFKKP